MKKKKLNIKKYHQIVDILMLKIENIIDNYQGNDILDFEINNNIMKIIFKNKNQILITRQEYLKEIWIATKKNGYHFKYYNKNWICIKKKKTINQILKNIFFQETKKKIFLKLFNK